MTRDYAKSKSINRKSWAPGPWDNEPDFYEWTTNVGYPAWAARLESGTWYGVVEAPLPKDKTMEFHHTIRDKRRHQFEHNYGMVVHTDKEDIGGFVLSMEHWESPGPSTRDWFRGSYKTLEDLKESCEIVAQDIFETHRDGTYVNYFQR